MTVIDLTDEKFEETILANEIVIVDFWATWCGPCRQFAPIFEGSSKKNDDIVFAKVDTDEQQQLAAAAQIQSIPTLMAFKGGQLIFRQSGSLPGPELESLIEQIRLFDISAAQAENETVDAPIE